MSFCPNGFMRPATMSVTNPKPVGYSNNKSEIRLITGSQKKVLTLVATVLLALQGLLLCSCANHPIPPPAPPAANRPRTPGSGDIR
jgi:hypothetical protein